MATTAGAILRRAFTAMGVIQPGEWTTFDSDNKADALERLNNMVSSWRTQFGTVPAIERNIFPIVAGKQTYTIGTGGDFNVPRPLVIDGAGLLLNGLGAAKSATITRSSYTATVTVAAHGLSVGSETVIAGANQGAYNGLQTVQTVPTSGTFTFTLDGLPTTPATGTITETPIVGQPVEIPRPVLTEDAYQATQIKNLANGQFTNVYYNASNPFGTIVLWPSPTTSANQLVLYLQMAFEGFADLDTLYDYPTLPGYTVAMEDNVCLELFTAYGVIDSTVASITRKAAKTLGLIKRANNQMTDLATDAQALTRDHRGGYNIQTGEGG